MTQKNFSTPPIPSFIFSFKGIDVPLNENNKTARWINAFNDEYIGSKVINFYPTETLFGDWNGEILILAQDALPASALKKLILTHLQNGDPKEFAWRHASREINGDKKGYRTNDSLRNLVSKYTEGYGVLYGSAAANMLYEDGCEKYSQVLRGFKDNQLQSYLIDVLSWVVKNMPKLKCIMCLGEKAWQIVNVTGQTRFVHDFKSMRESGQKVVTMISNRKISIIPAYHPAARVSTQERGRNWESLTELLKNQTTQ